MALDSALSIIASILAILGALWGLNQGSRRISGRGLYDVLYQLSQSRDGRWILLITIGSVIIGINQLTNWIEGSTKAAVPEPEGPIVELTDDFNMPCYLEYGVLNPEIIISDFQLTERLRPFAKGAGRVPISAEIKRNDGRIFLHYGSVGYRWDGFLVEVNDVIDLPEMEESEFIKEFGRLANIRCLVEAGSD